MGATKRDRRDERRERLAELQAAQKRAERRRSRIIWAAVIAAVVALAVPATLLIVDAQRRNDEVAATAGEPIEGEQVVEVPSATHVTTDVPDESAPTVAAAEGRLPPLGGDHDPTVQNCGVYVEPVRDENAVHSLEHGAVWVTYRPDTDARQVERLGELAAAEPYLLVSPYEDLASPVVATAWGVQLEVDSVDDERLEAFIARYAQGEQTPEPGAPCSGGIGG